MSQIFVETKKFREAIDVINNFPDSGFLKFLQRVIAKINQDKSDSIFTIEEESKFLSELNLTHDKFVLLLEACSFIFEQAAYMSYKLKGLDTQLSKTSINETKRKFFLNVWEKRGDQFIQNLSNKHFGFPPLINEIKYELHVPLSSSNTKLDRTPYAQIELLYDPPPSTTLTSSSSSSTSTSAPSTITSGSSSSRSLLFELDHAQLSQLSRQLDIIQDQLDSLS